MLRQSKRHRKLLLAALVLPFVGVQVANTQPVSAENFGQSELVLVTAQAPTIGPPSAIPPSEMTSPQDRADQPLSDPNGSESTYESPSYETPSYNTPSSEASSYDMSSYAPAAACNCVDVKEKKAAALAGLKKAYAGVFYGNNFDYLEDPYYEGPRFFSDNFKNIKTQFGTFSFGGETRYRYHNERNHRGRVNGVGGLGISGNDDNFWLQRNRLYADWKLNDKVRAYGEVLDADSFGESLPSRPIEVNDLDLLNLFVDVKLFDNDYGKLTVRGGRQELLYGAQRTVSPLDFANTRRTFDGVRALYQNGDTSLDAFWTQLVIVDPNDADNSSPDNQFWGTYLTQKNTSIGQVEGYYLGTDSRTPNNNTSLSTIGGRVSGKTKNNMLYEFEGAYQFGDDATDSGHSAGFVTAGIGHKFETNLLSPTVWLYYDFASGEEDFDQVGRGDGSYDHLFPLAHKYNGFIDLFGRRNLHDLNILTTTPLNKKVTFLVWYHYFALAEETTAYDIVLAPYDAVDQATSRDLGHEIDFAFNINLNARNNLFLGYSHFSGGDYYDSPGVGPDNGDNDADFFNAQFTTRY